MTKEYPFMGFIARKKYPQSGYPCMDNLGMNPITKKIADRLNQARKNSKSGKAMTLKEIAIKSGIPYSTVQRISKAETDPQISNLVSIAKALDLELSDLLNERSSDVLIFKNSHKLTDSQSILVQNLIDSLTGELNPTFLSTEQVIQRKRAQDLIHLDQLDKAKSK